MCSMVVRWRPVSHQSWAGGMPTSSWACSTPVVTVPGTPALGLNQAWYIELRCQNLGKSSKTPGIFEIIEVGIHPHYPKLRRLSSDCYSPQQAPKTQLQEDARTQPQDSPRTPAQTPQPHRESSRTRTQPANDDRHQHPL